MIFNFEMPDVMSDICPRVLEDLRVAEVVRQDVAVEGGKITAFRVRLNLSFKYDKDK